MRKIKLIIVIIVFSIIFSCTSGFKYKYYVGKNVNIIPSHSAFIDLFLVNDKNHHHLANKKIIKAGYKYLCLERAGVSLYDGRPNIETADLAYLDDDGRQLCLRDLAIYSVREVQ